MAETIGARHHSLQRLRRLSRRRSARTGEGAFVLDGPTLLADALAAGIVVEEVVAEPGCPEALLAEAAAAGATVRRAPVGALARAVDTVTPHGVAAVARMAERAAGDVLGAAGPLALVLIGVSDPGNAGTLLRSAEASGAGAVVFSDGSVDPFGPKCVRSSAGSVLRLAVARDGDSADALAACAAHGRRTVGTVVRAGTPYDTVDLRGPVALVLGNEAHGLPPGVAEAVDEAVTIPMAGRAESLNVAMAGTVLCFEAMRQRRAATIAPQQGNRLPVDRHGQNRDAPEQVSIYRTGRDAAAGGRVHDDMTDPTSSSGDELVAEIGRLEDEARARIASAATLDELRAVESEVAGKRSPMNAFRKRLGGLDGETRRTVGKVLNAASDAVRVAATERRAVLEAASRTEQLLDERIDLTEVLPGTPVGSLHLVTQAMRELEDLFVGMGFTVAEGPEVETDWHNFGALNFPPDHPARDMYDTLYVELRRPRLDAAAHPHVARCRCG